MSSCTPLIPTRPALLKAAFYTKKPLKAADTVDGLRVSTRKGLKKITKTLILPNSHKRDGRPPHLF